MWRGVVGVVVKRVGGGGRGRELVDGVGGGGWDVGRVEIGEEVVDVDAGGRGAWTVEWGMGLGWTTRAWSGGDFLCFGGFGSDVGGKGLQVVDGGKVGGLLLVESPGLPLAEEFGGGEIVLGADFLGDALLSGGQDDGAEFEEGNHVGRGRMLWETGRGDGWGRREFGRSVKRQVRMAWGDGGIREEQKWRCGG